MCLALRTTPRRRLQLATALAGGAFVWCVVEAPTAAFAQLPRAFAMHFHHHRGFFHVLHWLEQHDQPEELSAFFQTMAVFHEQASATTVNTEPSPVFRTATELLTHMQLVVAWETYLLVSKMALQWGLLVFLSRTKAVSTRLAVPCVCLSMLSLICAKMAQSTLLEMLAQSVSFVLPSTKQKDRAAFMAAFLGLLFLVRFAAVAIVSGVLAYSYQAFFDGWPPARWKDMPRWIGSKNVALSTLFYSVASVSVMAMSMRSLRSLSEAACHIESVALIGAFSHFLVHELELTASITPKATTTSSEKPKQT